MSVDYIDSAEFIDVLPYLKKASDQGYSAAIVIYRGVEDSEVLFGEDTVSAFVVMPVATADLAEIIGDLEHDGMDKVDEYPPGWGIILQGHLSVIVAKPETVTLICYEASESPVSQA